MVVRNATPAVLGAVVALASCGYDWTVVPKDESSGSSGKGSSGVSIACGEVECDSATSFCVLGPKGSECVSWSCDERTCEGCKGQASAACADATCSAKGDAVFVRCP